MLFEGWDSFFPEAVAPSRRGMSERQRDRLCSEVLPAFLPHRRWYAGKHKTINRVELVNGGAWPRDDDIAQSASSEDIWLLSWIRTTTVSGREDVYFLPLARHWGDAQEEPMRSMMPHALARTRREAEFGIVFDALHDEAFCWPVVRAMGAGVEAPLQAGRIRFWSTSTYAELMPAATAEGSVRLPLAEDSNSAMVIGEQLFLKVFRNLREGLNPEVEMGQFLTERSPFAHIVRLAGAFEYVAEDGTVTTLGVMQEYLSAQGDAWNWIADYPARFLEGALLRPNQEQWANIEATHAGHLALVRRLGVRTGELHTALVRPTGDPAFAPEPVLPADIERWQGEIEAEVEDKLAVLEQEFERLPSAVQARARALLDARSRLLERVRMLTGSPFSGVKLRFHGDYHLGQVLVRENDFAIIDFEGEPARTMAERRQKHTPLKDVAGMLRLLDYAARTAVNGITMERELPDPAVLDARAVDWRERAKQAFLAGFAQGVAAEILGEGLAAATPMLDLLLLQKALYELPYELGNRPLWVQAPIGGLLKLVD